jgi:drug/metabolite transporter (DMT)-like permease
MSSPPAHPGRATAGPAAAPAAHPGRVRAALIAVQVLFGVHYLAAKWIVAELSPAAWALLRVGGAAALLAPMAWLARRSRPGRHAWPARRDLGYLALCAFFGVVLNQALFLEGIARTTPGHSALINSQIPTFALVAAVLLGEERLSRRKLASLLAGAAGVLVLLEVDRLRVAREWLAGDLLNLANAASYGLFVAMSRRLMARTDPLAATAVLFAFGSVGMALYGGRALAGADLGALTARAWSSMAFALLGATVLTYLLNLWALARTTASRVALWIFVQPVIAAALSAGLTDERITPRFVVATALVFAALFLQESPRQPWRWPPAKAVRGTPAA